MNNEISVPPVIVPPVTDKFCRNCEHSFRYGDYYKCWVSGQRDIVTGDSVYSSCKSYRDNESSGCGRSGKSYKPITQYWIIETGASKHWYGSDNRIIVVIKDRGLYHCDDVKGITWSEIETNLNKHYHGFAVIFEGDRMEDVKVFMDKRRRDKYNRLLDENNAPSDPNLS